MAGLGRDLLEGMDFALSPAFESWLLSERRHVKASSEAILREAALARLGSGDPRGAAEFAARLVQLNPLPFPRIRRLNVSALTAGLTAGHSTPHVVRRQGR